MTYIIAEAGVNHNGSISHAIKLIEAAKSAGADCIKFQTFKAKDIVTSNSPKANYQLKVTSENESQLEMLTKLELDQNAFVKLKEICEVNDIDFLSTPYNIDDLDFLCSIGVKSLKIASGQLTELSFIKYVAKKNITTFISTGMSYMSDILKVVEIFKQVKNSKLIILQCTTNYPSKLEDANINVIKTLNAISGIKVGYSDHVKENYACFAAVSLGVHTIEKHFTLDKTSEGPDHSSSLNPVEFKKLVSEIRKIEIALGSYDKFPSDSEKKNIMGMKRSLLYKHDIKKGTLLDHSDFSFKRPFDGLSPNEIKYFIGKKLDKDVIKDEKVRYRDIL
ncbi:N-acetylneuraminate synthase family protein [Flavobacteriaceae bacterium]|nr:N-acetylneuraminate synthase family protein [Flavobacteriaceae bacterium]